MELRSFGIEPYAISRDSPWSHVAWAQALDVELPLLSDWNGEATRAFGVGQEYRGLRDVSARSVFLVDGDGVVRYARRYENNEVPDPDEVVAAASALGEQR